MNKSNDIFIEAAHTWNELTAYQYNITYGYKATLRNVNITFEQRHFPHLAGFQYLKDITLPQYPAKQIVTKILEGKIKYTSIIKSMYFEELVKPRLEALILLKNILDNDFSLFSYTPQLYPFRTSIKADFLISIYINSVNFIFIIKSTEVIQQNKIIYVALHSLKVTEIMKPTNANELSSKKNVSIYRRIHPLYFLTSLVSIESFLTKIFLFHRFHNF